MARRAVPLLISALMVTICAIFIMLRANSPFDCTFTTEWRTDGVVVQVVDDCPPGGSSSLRTGDLVTAIDGHPVNESASAPDWAVGQSADYTVVRDGSVRSVPVDLIRPDLVSGMSLLWPGMIIATVFVAMAVYLVWRHFNVATGALLVSAAGFATGTPLWWLGLPAIGMTEEFQVRLFIGGSAVMFGAAWAATLTFVLMFPRPFRGIAGWPPIARWVLCTAPFWIIVGWTVATFPLSKGFTDYVVQIVTGLAFVYIAVSRLRQPMDAVARQQLRWLLGGLVLGITTYLAGWLIPQFLIGEALPPELNSVPAIPFLIGLAVAVLRYRLFDLEVVLNRGLVYGLLTATVVTVYFGIIAATAGVLGRGAVTPAAIVATAAVAVAVNPLRLLLQRTVDRLMYGDRDDPYSALSRLERRLDATGDQDRVLTSVADDVTNALRVPYVEIDVGERHVEAGTRPRWLTGENGRYDIPLTDGAERIGMMSLAPRAPGAAFSRADQRLAHDLARRVSAAARELSLRADLQRSREQLILAREEERRALRRALHDEFGPVVAGLGLQTEAARKIIKTDSSAASATLSKVRADADHLVADIRRLAYDLRPPALDELGLAGAIRRYARTVDNLDVIVTVRPDPLGGLPAAVEAAAYRIAAEAITNARRHADAERCGVTLASDNATLTVEVADDGRGLPLDFTAGVGVSAMRERAAELGGSCRIERSTSGGTVVRATLPVPSGGGDRDGQYQS